jgi:hypothetical protein
LSDVNILIVRFVGSGLVFLSESKHVSLCYTMTLTVVNRHIIK